MVDGPPWLLDTEKAGAVREFEDIRSALGLQKFLESATGTLYFNPAADGADRVLVRRFDATVPAELAAVYADLVSAVADWVDATPDVARYVRVERPLEVGRDFIARPHPIYFISTDAYDPGGPLPPPELDEMHKAVRTAMMRKGGNLNRGEHTVIERVVTATLLEPTGRTYFNENDDLFVVVEPKIDAADVHDWETVSRQSGYDRGTPAP